MRGSARLCEALICFYNRPPGCVNAIAEENEIRFIVYGMNSRRNALLSLAVFGTLLLGPAFFAWQAQTESENKVVTETDCSALKLGSDIPVSAIAEPVAGVRLNAPRWVPAAGASPAYCSIDGVL